MVGVPATKALDRSALPGHGGDNGHKTSSTSTINLLLHKWLVGVGFQGGLLPVVMVALNMLCILTCVYPTTLLLTWAIDSEGGHMKFVVANCFIPLMYLVSYQHFLCLPAHNREGGREGSPLIV